MPPQIDALIKDEPGLRSTPPLPQAPLPPSELTISEDFKSIQAPIPILNLRPVRPDSTSSTASSRSNGTNTQSSLTITPLVSPKVSLPTEPEQPLAASSSTGNDNPHFLAAMASAASMALTNPLLLNPLLFSTSMMQSLNESDLIKSMKSLIPQMPPAAAMAAALPMTMWSLTSQFKKPVIGDTFNGSFAEEEVANIRHLLENVNASVTKSLLEDNLKKWASTCGLSTNEILQQLANSQPLSPGQLKEENDLDTSIGSSSEVTLPTFEADSKKASGGRPRAMISDEQVATLKAYYGVNPKPRREDLINISEEIGHPFKVVKVWFQNTRARDRREAVNSKAFTKHLLPPTPPASCSESQKCVSPSASPLKEDLSEDKIPLDLSTKPSTPSASPPPLVINSEAEDSEEDDEDMESDDDNEEEEEMEVSSTPAFPMTSRPPIDIEQLAKQHFDNMIRAKLVTLEPTAEAMLPDAPVSSSEVAKTTKKKVSSNAALASAATSASTSSSALSTVSSTSSSSNGSNQTIYTCDQCDKTFTKKSSITRHKYEHSGNYYSFILYCQCI